MEGIMKIINQVSNTALYLPESFEWLILMSDCLDDPSIRKMSADWGGYINSRQFFSWEQFFSDLLIQKNRELICNIVKKHKSNIFKSLHWIKNN